MLNLKKSLITAALGILSATPALAGAQVYVRIAPPRPVYEVPPAPRPGYVWHPGYQRWDGARYVWTPGNYVVAPYAHAFWVPGHWVRRQGGWFWMEGHWRR